MPEFDPNVTADFCCLNTFNPKDRARTREVRRLIKEGPGLYEMSKRHLPYDINSWILLIDRAATIIKEHGLDCEDVSVTYGVGLRI